MINIGLVQAHPIGNVMDRSKLSELALLGILSGLIFTSEAEAEVTQEETFYAKGGCGGRNGCGNHSASQTDRFPHQTKNYYDDYKRGPEEKALFDSLTDEEKAIYQSLTPEAKQLVLKVAGKKR